MWIDFRCCTAWTSVTPSTSATNVVCQLSFQVKSENWKLRIRSCRLSIMAFNCQLWKWLLHLVSLNFKFSLEQATFSLELLLLEKHFIFEFEFSLLMATLAHRSLDINHAFHLYNKCCEWLEFQSISTWLGEFTPVSSILKIDSQSNPSGFGAVLRGHTWVVFRDRAPSWLHSSFDPTSLSCVLGNSVSDCEKGRLAGQIILTAQSESIAILK